MDGFTPLAFLVCLVALVIFIFMYAKYSRRQVIEVDDPFSMRMQRNMANSHPASNEINRYMREESVCPYAGSARKAVTNVANYADSHLDLLVLSVMAKVGSQFESYDLLQAISATGMQFGAMNIFHYYLPDAPIGSPLFSLASATEPGDFDLDHIGDFACPGLILFVRLSQVNNPAQAFKLMLKKAEQLAEDLDGELRADPYTPWDDAVLKEYQRKISATHALSTA